MAKIHIETDSTILAEALSTNKYDRMAAGVIFKEARAFMHLNFQSCVSSLSPRACNRVAHKLAAIGASCEPDSLFLFAETAPDDVRLLVASDSAVSLE
jgi:hypothetical protein